jgi:hypothetical protein
VRKRLFRLRQSGRGDEQRCGRHDAKSIHGFLLTDVFFGDEQ